MSFPTSNNSEFSAAPHFSPRKVSTSPQSLRFEKRMGERDGNSSTASSVVSATSDLNRQQHAQLSLHELLVEAELSQYHSALRSKLKLQHAEHLRFVKDEDLLEIGMSKPEQRRLWKVFHRRCPSGGLVGKLKRKVFSRSKTSKEEQGKSKSEMSRSQSLETTHPSEQHIIPATAITLCKQLGTGEFGSVWQGVWSPSGGGQSERLQVAVKCVSSAKLQANPLDFLQEAAIMHKIAHPNVVRLYGVVLETKSIMLVNELAPLRSLLECLKEPNLRPSFPVLKLCDYAQQICDGMRYLESKRLIHRDLAARNILVYSTDKVKISDFGLSRALGVGEEYYRSNFSVSLKLPIAWCAPECITFLKFTSASDVWAFGVTLWELFTYGFQPWAGMTGQQILDAIDTPKSQRLDMPDACPQEFHSLMLQCWEHDPNNRPKFSDIYPVFPEIRPERVQAIQACKDGQRDHLQVSNGTIITVLNKRPKEYPDGYFWKGALDSGQIGLFLPQNTVAYLSAECPQLPPNFNQNSLGGSLGNLNAAHSKGGKMSGVSHGGGIKIDRTMISGPQGDLRHTGHVGVDKSGQFSMFGNLPKQIVNPLRNAETRSCTNSPLPLERVERFSTAETTRLESTASESAFLLPPSPFIPTSASLDPVEPTEALESETDASSPDLDVPTFENPLSKDMSDGGPSLLDEVFEELERGSMSSRVADGREILMAEIGCGRNPVFSVGTESEWGEPVSPTTTIHPVDTTDTTRLLGSGYQRQKDEGTLKQNKPEALVRPLSFTDARLLNDFTQMAQKMSDKTLRLEREHLIQELEQREQESAGQTEEGTRLPTGNIRETLARLKLPRQGSMERENSEFTPRGEGVRKTFSDNLPKQGMDMFASTEAWTPMAEDAYKALIECGSAVSHSVTEDGDRRRDERRETTRWDREGAANLQNELRSSGGGDTSALVRQNSLEEGKGSHPDTTGEEEQESNPLRLLRNDAVGVARSFKPGGSRRGRAAFIQPIRAEQRPIAAQPALAEQFVHAERNVPVREVVANHVKAPPPVPPKPPRSGLVQKSTKQHEVEGEGGDVGNDATEELLPTESPGRVDEKRLDFTMETVDKYDLLDFVLSALEKTKETKTEEEEQRIAVPNQVEYADLAVGGRRLQGVSGSSEISSTVQTEASNNKNLTKINGASPEFSGSLSLRGHNEDTVNL